jgi:hypothetical protein
LSRGKMLYWGAKSRRLCLILTLTQALDGFDYCGVL